MAGIIEGMKGFFRSSKPAARLAEIEAAIAAAETERKQHSERRPAEIVAKLTGDPAAAARVDAIYQATAALDARLRDLYEARDELRRRMASEAAEVRRREAEARPRRLAELRRQRLDQVRQLADRMAGAAAAMTALEENGRELADLLDDGAARNFFHPGAFRVRAGNAFARAFAIDPNRALTALNNRLGIASAAIGERAHWTIEEWETQGLDDIALFFTDQAEAEAARERLTARAAAQRQGAHRHLMARDDNRLTAGADSTAEVLAGRERLAQPGPQPAVVKLPGEVFAVVPPEQIFGDREAAVAAAQNRRVAVIPHEGGFVLLPERFAAAA